MWKASAAKKAVAALASFPSKITMDNHKQMIKLKDVGKGTVAMVRGCAVMDVHTTCMP